jgi:hypothetical protein
MDNLETKETTYLFGTPEFTPLQLLMRFVLLTHIECSIVHCIVIYLCRNCWFTYFSFYIDSCLGIFDHFLFTIFWINHHFIVKSVLDISLVLALSSFCVLYPGLPLSLDCPFLIVLLGFSNLYLFICRRNI